MAAEILIPKSLRLDWVDVMALDIALSKAAFKVACAIGWHFNKNTGCTYVSYGTLTAKLGFSERTIRAAIKELESRGYMVVERHRCGIRVADGVPAYGGKGHANVYRPAFGRGQESAGLLGAKLAERCRVYSAQTRQKSAANPAANCLPTLTPSPTEKENPSDFIWIEEDSALDRACAVYIRQRGKIPPRLSVDPATNRRGRRLPSALVAAVAKQEAADAVLHPIIAAADLPVGRLPTVRGKGDPS